MALAWVAFQLRTSGFVATQRRLSRSARRSRSRLKACDPAQSVAEAHARTRAVTLSARNLPGQPRCLTRSLSLWWLLRRRGIDARMCVGVRPLGDAIEAHAWVESDGRVLNDHPDVAQVFKAFDGDIAAISDAIRGASTSRGDGVDPSWGIE